MALQKGRRENQRERLLAAMTYIATHDGYTAANVREVVALAGVSRPTFYEYFADRDSCFLAAVAEVQRLAFARIRDEVAAVPPEQAIRATIGALVAFASTEPSLARLLMGEVTVAGPRSLDAREAGIAQIAELVEAAHRRVAPATEIPDLSPPMLVGAVSRMLARRLRGGERSFPTLVDELSTWLASYDQPIGSHRWSALKPMPPPPPTPFATELPLYAPPALAPGRQRLSAGEVAQNHRQRILVAIAHVIADKGLHASTVADITSAAGLDRRAFYSLFRDKEDAFGALHEVAFQHVTAATARAFFSVETWPERVWEASRTFAQLLDQDRTLALLAVVEVQATVPGALQRVDEMMTNYIVFLQEGFRYCPRADPPTPLALEALALHNFEVTHYGIRSHTPRRGASLAPHATYVCLAPFLGSDAANEFIDRELGEALESADSGGS